MSFSRLLLNAALILGTVGASAAEPTKSRVVTLIPSLGEIAAEILGGEERIAGVVEYTDFPATLSKKPTVGTYAKPNLEKIISLKPDLVLASRDGTPPALIVRLERLKIPVLTVGTDSIEKLRESCLMIGEAVGTDEGAKLAARIDREIEAVKARAERRKKNSRAHPKVLLQVGDEPLVVVGGTGFLDEALAILGVTNAYADSKQPFPRVSVEDALKRDPEVILLIALGNDLKPFERAKKRWESYPKLAATRGGRIRILRSDSLVRPGPRFAQGLRELEAALFEGLE
jgi:iron complex transport system substrate-binding protein